MSDSDFPILIKKITGENISLNVKASNTVRDIKQKITDRDGVALDNIYLYFSGNNLKDNTQTLEDLSIHEHATIHMVLRLPGGSQ